MALHGCLAEGLKKKASAAPSRRKFAILLHACLVRSWQHKEKLVGH
jgi:hypothetical protein